MNIFCKLGIHYFKLINKETNYLSDWSRQLSINFGNYHTKKTTKRYKCFWCDKNKINQYNHH